MRKNICYVYYSNLKIFKEATNLDDLYEDTDAASQHSVHWEVEEVKGICKRLQRATLVPSFDKILVR